MSWHANSAFTRSARQLQISSAAPSSIPPSPRRVDAPDCSADDSWPVDTYCENAGTSQSCVLADTGNPKLHGRQVRCSP